MAARQAAFLYQNESGSMKRRCRRLIWKERKTGIADEVALGVTYNEIDDYLEGKSVSAQAQETIESWWHKGQV